MARPVAQLGREVGVEWWTVMHAVMEHGIALVEDPALIVSARRRPGVNSTGMRGPAKGVSTR